EIVNSQIVLKKKKKKANDIPKITSEYKSSGSIQSVNVIVQDTLIKVKPDSSTSLNQPNTDIIQNITANVTYQDSVVDPVSLKYYKIKAKNKKELNQEYLDARKKLREQYLSLSDSLQSEEASFENKF